MSQHIIPTGRFRAVVDGKPLTVQVIAADVLRWEQNNKAAFVGSDGSMPLSRMAWVAWAAASRLGLYDETVATWLTSIESLESLDDRDEATQRGELDADPVLPDPTEADTTA
ncbi:hypothetical protein ACTQ29_08900 [Bifidobacterium boum]|uniref:hypothetical protein n=1 Tax=Bacillati TaxID=1783272 RepID=UPI003F892864